MARYVLTACTTPILHLHFLCFCRDCLAAPGTTVADTGAPVGNPNKNKTCYKCQQEGHVSDRVSRLSTLPDPYDDPRSLATVPRTLTMPPDCLPTPHPTVIPCKCRMLGVRRST